MVQTKKSTIANARINVQCALCLLLSVPKYTTITSKLPRIPIIMKIDRNTIVGIRLSVSFAFKLSSVQYSWSNVGVLSSVFVFLYKVTRKSQIKRRFTLLSCFNFFHFCISYFNLYFIYLIYTILIITTFIFLKKKKKKLIQHFNNININIIIHVITPKNNKNLFLRG